MAISNSSKFRVHIGFVLKFCVVLTGVLWLASCQIFSKSELVIDEESTKTYQGRIVFKSPDQSFVTIFRWVGSDSVFELTLRDRLALGGVRLQGTDNQVTIEYSNGQKVKDANLDDWIEENLGLALPFKELWKCFSLECKLIDDSDTKEFDQFGRLEAFSSEQWAFVFSYEDSDKDSTTLKKLEMRKDDTEIRIFFTKFEN